MKRMSVIILMYLLSCVQYTKYIPDPEKDIEEWIDSFSQQRSFSYHCQLQTQSVYTEVKGDCVIGRGEHNHGEWKYADSRLKFEHIGLRDIQYSRQNGKWEVSARGEESDILVQIKRLLEFDKFEYVGSEKAYVYRFKANIPFLAPGRWKEMIGLIKISRNNYLPETIWAGLPDSSVFWKIELSNYNKKKRIQPPLRHSNRYSLVFRGDYLKAVKRRLKLNNVDHSVRKRDNDIILTVPKQYNIEDIRMMLSSRILNVYGLAKCKEEASRVGYLKGNINTPLFLSRKLLDQEDIKDAKIRFDAASKPYLQLSLDKKIVPTSRIAIEIDSIIVGTSALDTLKKLDKINAYTDMQYCEMQILRGSLLESLPTVEIKEIAEELN